LTMGVRGSWLPCRPPFSEIRSKNVKGGMMRIMEWCPICNESGALLLRGKEEEKERKK
jgi:hypothetical protein